MSESQEQPVFPTQPQSETQPQLETQPQSETHPQPVSETQVQKPVSDTQPQLTSQAQPESETQPQPLSETQEQVVFDTQSQPVSCTQGQSPGTQLQVQTAPAGITVPHGTVYVTPFLMYTVPLAADEDAATSMKHTAAELPCGSEYNWMFLPEATAK